MERKTSSVQVSANNLRRAAFKEFERPPFVGDAAQCRGLLGQLELAGFQDLRDLRIFHHRFCREDRAGIGKALDMCGDIDGLAEVVEPVVEGDREARSRVNPAIASSWSPLRL